jgi:hypothetical protein
LLKIISGLALRDAKSIRRVEAAEIYKIYDGGLEGTVKISVFGFIFKDMVEEKHLSSKLLLRDIVKQLDPMNHNSISLTDFIAWIDTVCFNFSLLLFVMTFKCLFSCFFFAGSKY